MKKHSYCQNKNASCSACCGLNNLKLDFEKKRDWVRQNTEEFLGLDISKKENIVAFRKRRENETRHLLVHEKTYTCPFIGFIDTRQGRTGCLLHPLGSPHKQISLYKHPQNFSFYGEGICLSYDCRSKEKQMLPSYHFDAEIYSQVTANHNLLQCCNLLVNDHGVDEVSLYQAVIARLKRRPVPVSSFELPMAELKQAEVDTWYILGSLLDQTAYDHDNIHLTESGRQLGRQIKQKLVPGSADI